MEKMTQLYEGKAKKVYATEDPAVVIVSYKDDATALDGLKKGTIAGKGVVNNRMTNFLMQLLEKNGVPTHFVEELNDRETAVKKVSIVPLEVIIRNVSAGHFAQRYGVEEGIVFDEPTIEFSYKNDDLHDPPAQCLSRHRTEARDPRGDRDDQDHGLPRQRGADRVLPHPRRASGRLQARVRPSGRRHARPRRRDLPDTCRFWDLKTNEKLDKTASAATWAVWRMPTAR